MMSSYTFQPLEGHHQGVLYKGVIIQKILQTICQCTAKIEYYYYFLWLCSPARAMASSFTARFRDHTQRRATVGRTSDQLVAETST
jgi:hypothetical protein